MSEPMDINDYIPARIAFLQQRKRDLELEALRVEAALGELLNMTQPAPAPAPEPEKPGRMKRSK